MTNGVSSKNYECYVLVLKAKNYTTESDQKKETILCLSRMKTFINGFPLKQICFI